VAGDGRPADQRRDRAGGATDHDVLRRAPLQPDRVDPDVADEAAEREPGGEPVDGPAEQHDRGGHQQDAEAQRGRRRDASARDRRSAVRVICASMSRSQ